MWTWLFSLLTEETESSHFSSTQQNNQSHTCMELLYYWFCRLQYWFLHGLLARKVLYAQRIAIVFAEKSLNFCIRTRSWRLWSWHVLSLHVTREQLLMESVLCIGVLIYVQLAAWFDRGLTQWWQSRLVFLFSAWSKSKMSNRIFLNRLRRHERKNRYEIRTSTCGR